MNMEDVIGFSCKMDLIVENEIIKCRKGLNDMKKAKDIICNIKLDTKDMKDALDKFKKNVEVICLQNEIKLLKEELKDKEFRINLIEEENMELRDMIINQDALEEEEVGNKEIAEEVNETELIGYIALRSIEDGEEISTSYILRVIDYINEFSEDKGIIE